MRLKQTIFVFFLFLTFSLSAQEKTISLREIWGGAFKAESLEQLHSLKNGTQYTVLNSKGSGNGNTIDVYDYKTSEKVATLVTTSDLKELEEIKDYSFSADESKLLLAATKTSIYRRSSRGIYFVYNTNDKSLTRVSEHQIQEPTFSPDGSKVAYGYENNLYIKNLETGDTTQITTDGEKNAIINGITDWVYEEEFAFVRAFDWSASGEKIAYIRFDETEVPEFSMDRYGKDLYPTQDVFKYPKAGEKNAEVSLHLYDLGSQKTEDISINAFQSYYIPRIKWTNDKDILSVQTMNRKQNQLDLLFVDAATNTTKRILKETDAAYVDVTDDLTFLEDNSFIWTSEKSGWNHIYHYDKTGKLVNQVTNGEWEVTSYYGFDVATNQIFYQSTENGSINRDVYAISLNGKNPKRLTEKAGTHKADFSADFSVFIHTYASTETPPQYSLRNATNGKEIREIETNKTLANRLKKYTISPKEFSEIEIHGNSLNTYMIKPDNFDPDKKYPVLMFQYSGPGSQSVANTWNSPNDYWHQMLAQQGYIIVCVDGRGTGLKGRDFKKATQKELGKYELEDQVAAAKKIGDLPFVDAERIGIWGWSYGGFISSNCLFQAPDTFEMAIAVAPVTSWRFYDTIYTERYMETPQENASGYDDNSPISHVDKLKGSYLLVHGSADDNVHVQNTTRLVEELIQANKQFDWAIYPDKNHAIFGGYTRLHLYTKMTNFIQENL